jgi:hypothetical protein
MRVDLPYPAGAATTTTGKMPSSTSLDESSLGRGNGFLVPVAGNSLPWIIGCTCRLPFIRVESIVRVVVIRPI